MDKALIFGPLIRRRWIKSEGAGVALSKILPNIGGPRGGRRRANSSLLYGTPVLLPGIRIHKYKYRLLSAQKVTYAYRTVSTEAIVVIAGMKPIHLLAEEGTGLYNLEREGAASDA